MELQVYQENFIDFMIRSEVLLFGEFRLRSGRVAPYFINTGKYRTGEQMNLLSDFYAQTFLTHFSTLGSKKLVLYGPAYKGIPLVIALAINLAKKHRANLPFCFNRKEAKDHGEGGSLIGTKPGEGDSIIIIEDVTTAGTSIRETITLMEEEAPGAKIEGCVISVDRMEKGEYTDLSAVMQIQKDFGIQVFPIVTIVDIVGYLHNREIDGKVHIDDKMKEKIDTYRQEYGV